MAKVLIYDLATGRPIEYLKSANRALFVGKADAMFDPDPVLIEKPFKYLKVVGGVLMEKTPAEKAIADQEEAAGAINRFEDLVARVVSLEAAVAELKKPK